MEARTMPEMVIGVDFGMTQTGVVWCMAPWTSPQVFQDWSTVPGEVYDKVPSRVSYDRNTGRLKTWGLGCDLTDTTADIRDYFKLYLDPKYSDEYQDHNHASARQYYVDFMRCLHQHLVKWFTERWPHWDRQRVQWVFSVPTTWHNPAVIHGIEDLIESAGFAQDRPSHSVRITLTEAEAAAVCVAGQQMQRGEVVLVCDAGGGTTDVNVLKMMSARGEAIRLQSLAAVEGQPVGSALIDIEVQQYLEACLDRFADRLRPLEPAKLAEQMTHGKFERQKRAFGTPANDVPRIHLEIPGLPPGIHYAPASITNSSISITRDQLRALFDKQVKGMMDLIDGQIQNLLRTSPEEQVSILVMSGGLGSSAYVREQFDLYCRRVRHPNAQKMRVILAAKPQLAPALGLAMERAQEIGRGITPISNRQARISYAVVVNQVWQPERHIGQKIIRDPRDGKRWAIGQLEWLIKKAGHAGGDRVTEEGVEKRVHAKIQHAQLDRPWKAQFVTSDLPREQLPTSMSEHGVRTLCIVEVNLRNNVPRTVHNKHWWNRGLRYELAEFIIKLRLGSADVQFELWSDNRKVSHAHDELKVDWETGRHLSMGDLEHLD